MIRELSYYLREESVCQAAIGQLVVGSPKKRYAHKGQLNPEWTFAAFLDDPPVPRSRRQLIHQHTQFHGSRRSFMYKLMGGSRSALISRMIV